MLSTVIEIFAGAQGAGILGHIGRGLALRSIYQNAARVAKPEDHFGEAAPRAIFDDKFKARPVFPPPARQWR